MPGTSSGFSPTRKHHDAVVVRPYSFLEKQPELVFKNIVKLMAGMFTVPFAFISLIDDDRIFFKADYGIGTISTVSSNENFCALIKKYKEAPVYMQKFSEKVVLPNADADDPQDISFYASVPLINDAGYLIGNACIADTKTRKFGSQEKLQLEQIARVVMDEIELRKSAIEATQKLLAINKSLKESIVKPTYLVLDAPAALGILCGREMIIESANNKLLGIWGKPYSVIGKPLKDVRTAPNASYFLQILDNVFTSGKPYFGSEVMAEHLRGKKLHKGYYNFVYHPLKNDDGVVISIFVIGVEISREIEARKKIEQVESLLRMATDAGEIGTWFMDAKTRKFIPSSRLKNMFGYNVNEKMSVEKALAQVDEAYQGPVRAAMELCINTGERFDVEFPYFNKRNTNKYWVKAMGNLYTASEGIPGHFSGTVIDISKAKQNDQLKNDFISIVSHELKTPLTAIKAIIQLLTPGKGSDLGNDGMDVKSTRKLTYKAEKLVVKMINMIDAYLEVKKIDEGKMNIVISPVHIYQLIKKAVGQAKDAGSTHHFTITCSKSLVCNVDKIKIEQVIDNLLNNAVKYAPRETDVDIACVEEEDKVIFSIKDTGKGLPQKELSKLFRKFYRGDAENSSMTGFGVGLYICSEIINGHGGTIWAESEPGKGTTFYFQVPKNHS